MELEKCTGRKDLFIKDNGLKELKTAWDRYGTKEKLYKKDSMITAN
jgi:hypothetical protein